MSACDGCGDRKDVHGLRPVNLCRNCYVAVVDGDTDEWTARIRRETLDEVEREVKKAVPRMGVVGLEILRHALARLRTKHTGGTDGTP
jgi:hypothetical protein